MRHSPVALAKFRKAIQKHNPACTAKLRLLAAYAESMRGLTLAMREIDAAESNSSEPAVSSTRLERASHRCDWNLAALDAFATAQACCDRVCGPSY